MEDPVGAALRVRLILLGAPVFLVLFGLLVATSATPVRPVPAMIVAGGIAAVALAVGVRHVRAGPFRRGPSYSNGVTVVVVAAAALIASLGPGPSTAFSTAQSFVVLAVTVLALDGRRRVIAAVAHSVTWLVTSWLLDDPTTQDILTGATFQAGALCVVAFGGRLFAEHVVTTATATGAAREARAEAALAREHERTRIAEEVHDHALQLVIAAHQDLAEVEADEPAVRDARERIDDAMHALRGLSVTLNEERLADIDPGVALEHAVAQFRGSGRPQVRLEVGAPVPVPHTGWMVETVRELLANVRRHADAQTATVVVDVRDDTIEIVVADDGRGVDPARVAEAASAGHLGIWRLEQRVRELGGTFALTAPASGGTRAVVRVPVRDG